MTKKYLVVNAGSASKKYALYEQESELFRAHFEMEGGHFIISFGAGNKMEKADLASDDYGRSADYLVRLLMDGGYINAKEDIAAIAFRVVAPGRFFAENKLIDDNYQRRLAELYQMAPLHIGATFDEIKQFTEIFSNIPFVAISDSAFHKNLPLAARTYALAASDAEQLDIYRCGYHGISASSIVATIQKTMPALPSRVIICHLGSGVSITAVKDGQSFDTSMGFMPIEGVPMATRVGDIDVGAVTYLAKQKSLSIDELDIYLNKQCGLLGVAGLKSGGVRELIELEKQGNERARLALEMFVYAIKKYIGAYTTAMGGLDLLVFTATIGERSALIRSRVCCGLECLGIKIDEEKNNNLIEKQ